MPGRKIPLITDQIYHVLNRGIADQPTFFGLKDYKRTIDTIRFYRSTSPPLRYSYFIKQPAKRRSEILEQLEHESDYLVDLLAYCLMPNHFHLLLYQLKDGGISSFVGKFVNSYTRYVNTKLRRVGPIFQGKFKAIRIETDEQLLHVQRYIHLNPYSGFVVKDLKTLESYPYSSLGEYLGLVPNKVCNRKLINGFFNNVDSFRKFIHDQADYQRRLQTIKRLVLEKEV